MNKDVVEREESDITCVSRFVVRRWGKEDVVMKDGGYRLSRSGNSNVSEESLSITWNRKNSSEEVRGRKGTCKKEGGM